MIKIIGGKLDGSESPMKLVTLTEKDETYILMTFKEGDTKHFFYMLAGSVPAEAMKTYKQRAGLERIRAEQSK